MQIPTEQENKPSPAVLTCTSQDDNLERSSTHYATSFPIQRLTVHAPKSPARRGG